MKFKKTLKHLGDKEYHFLIDHNKVIRILPFLNQNLYKRFIIMIVFEISIRLKKNSNVLSMIKNNMFS